jgi:hypothetical protein
LGCAARIAAAVFTPSCNSIAFRAKAIGIIRLNGATGLVFTGSNSPWEICSYYVINVMAKNPITNLPEIEIEFDHCDADGTKCYCGQYIVHLNFRLWVEYKACKSLQNVKMVTVFGAS